MKRELWGETELTHRLRVGGASAKLCRTIRDDLTRRLISTQRAAWRVLRANAELRQRVAELARWEKDYQEAIHYYEDMLDTYRMDNKTLEAQLNEWIEREATHCPEGVGFDELIPLLRAQLTAASQAEREWIDAEKELPEPGMYVQITANVVWQKTSATDFGYYLDAPVIAWRKLDEGESDERTD